jgi:hypothetical protein
LQTNSKIGKSYSLTYRFSVDHEMTGILLTFVKY